MSESTLVQPRGERAAFATLKRLVGSGEKIGLVTLPVLLAGLMLNVTHPSLFSVGGPSVWLRATAAVVLVPGIVVWVWSAVLFLTKVPRHELITSGPYRVVKHPLYAGMALLVLPWIGLLLDTWLGVLVGAVLYASSRMFAPAEEAALSKTFGTAWDDYCATVKLPWL